MLSGCTECHCSVCFALCITCFMFCFVFFMALDIFYSQLSFVSVKETDNRSYKRTLYNTTDYAYRLLRRDPQAKTPNNNTSF